jgi:hypothetical protein
MTKTYGTYMGTSSVACKHESATFVSSLTQRNEPYSAWHTSELLLMSNLPIDDSGKKNLLAQILLLRQ